MNSKGYTLMEVTLFLAISSALALVAFIGLGPRLRNVRFTDAVRGVEASITRAVAEAQQGKNTSSLSCSKPGVNGAAFQVSNSTNSEAGSSEDCVLNGLLIFFDEDRNQVRYQQVVSLREKREVAGCPDSITNAVELNACFGTRPLDDNNERSSDNYPLTNGLDQRTGGGNFISYAINPETGEKYTYLFENGNQVESFGVCYGLDIRRAELIFEEGSIEPKVEFNADC